ncbi:54S ribosomal protein L3 mitochondrial [Coemansia erecta]|uniref:Large ribosomal subunit protein mL44 n=1 Tax=Coemansia asiatica TaxID=1052880 RepID=A0A9W8CHJ7_9FUNG|nr:54S ribosomal protein L3 mitochondrial [Coemansia asiatica]KAJ2854375.1 54S ribosomal protein L3 mitochondrial [Coemansia erecta]
MFSVARTRLGTAGAKVASGRALSLSTFTSQKMAKQTRPIINNSDETTYAALEARLNVQFKDRGLMKQVCTHKSFDQGLESSNERLEWLGKRVLNLYVGEYLVAKYPNLPMESLQDVQHANFGMGSLAEAGKHFGMLPAMRWSSSAGPTQTVGATKVLGKAVQALVGAVYMDQGAAAAKEFVKRHLLTKPVDIEAVVQLKNPKTMLVELTKRKGLEYPIARLMKETGRFTSSPVFIVGVFCGTRMVGMGFGSSLKMAEYRAAKDALLKHYAKEIKDVQLVDADDSDLTFFKDSEATASASASAFAA